MRRLQDLSLKTILVLGSVLLVFVPFALTGVVWYTQTTTEIEGTVTSYGTEVLRQLQASLDTYFRQFQMRAFSLSNSDVLRDYLIFDSRDPYEQYLMQQRVSRDVFMNLAFDRPEVQNAGIVNQHGFTVAFQSRTEFLDSYRVASEALRERAETSFVVLGPWRPTTAGEVVSAVFMIPSLELPGQRGMLIVDLSWGALKRLFDDVRVGSAGSLLVFDRDGRPIYPAASTPLTPLAARNGQLVVSQRSVATGWTLQIQVRLSGLSGRLFRLRRMSTLVILGLLLLLVAATSGLALSVTRALGVLENGIAGVERGNLVPIAPATVGKELKRIHHGYNRMVERLHELIEVAHQAELREREMVTRALEAELMRIQSQVNPHFLYNTLEVINSYAIEAGHAAISRMIGSLADVFRYSVSSCQDLVRLEEELRHLESYVSIQREVYPALRVSFRLRKEDRETVLLPRLTLQPLVENALVHGYEGHRRRVEYVGVSAARVEHHLELVVRDQGRGMDKATKDELERRFSVPGTRHLGDRDSGPELHGRRPVGLWNLHCRLRLAFGDRYGLRIGGSDSHGTRVVVMVPASRGKGGRG